MDLLELSQGPPLAELKTPWRELELEDALSSARLSGPASFRACCLSAASGVQTQPTVWGRKQDNTDTLRAIHVDSVEAAVKRAVAKDST
jgi:hypothetical protein